MWKEILDTNLIIIDPPISTKQELFEGMVSHAYQHDYITHKKKFLATLIEREEMANTELIPGVALPHARSNVIDKLFVSIIVHHEGIDYQHPDNGEARIIFFFGCPEDKNREYLRLLAHASRLLRTEVFRKQILDAENVQQIAELIYRYDEQTSLDDEEGNFLMYLTLHNEAHTEDVLAAMVEIGITGATLLNGVSMARKMAYEMPVFAGLSYMAQGKSKSSQVIIATLTHRHDATKLVLLLKENGIDLDEQGVGFLHLIKVEKTYGTPEENLDL
ncbi:MAG: PTS sugar transporter subunit IIA [Candidatus Cloacimonetes bacterium]|nr:PTS sugar transporter subunit IIA [Candidatus Cloacimonadota bacterium]